MINFNFGKTAIYNSLIWVEFFPFKFARTIRKVFSWLFLISFAGFLYFSFFDNYSSQYLKISDGLSLLFAVLGISFELIEKFTEQKLKNPKPKFSLKKAAELAGKYNLVEILSFESARVVARAFKSAGRSSVGSLHLFYSLLINSRGLNLIFSRLVLNAEEITQAIEKLLEKYLFQKQDGFFEKTFEDVILESLKIADIKKHTKIEIWDLISALSKIDDTFKKILVFYKLNLEDIENLCWIFENNEEKIKKSKKFWEYENLAKKGTMVKGWTAAYTITLDKYAIDLTKTINENITDVLKERPEVAVMERILAKPQNNNVLLVGDPGKGKKSLVHALARKSQQGKSLAQVNYKRFVELNIQQLLAQTQDIEKAETLLDTIMKEVVFAGNIVLVINDFHNYVGQQTGKPGIIDISGIISHYLQLPNFQFIAIANYEGLHRYIEKNPSILSYFEKVEASGVTDKETFLILENMIFGYEKKYKIFISYPALKEIISLSERYLPSLPYPDKAIDILNQAVVYVFGLKKEKVVLPSHIAKIITEKTQIPVGEMAEKEKETLLELENLIHQRIINQEEAVKEVSTALKRARADITIRKGPMGAFLFLGPTGVGKTETSKALAEIYFGAESKMIRLDMSEFQEIKDISRLIGSAQTEAPGLLTSQVNESPFSLVLLDEFEKAHPDILNLFLQVFDEGHLTDGLGRKIDFRNTILIATSNAGYQLILESIKQVAKWGSVKEKLLDELYKEGKFRPELINRFDAVVVFRPLTKENLLDIAQLMFSKLQKNLKGKGIEFIITQALKEKIAELGYNPIYGAREMRRVIQDKVENVLAEEIIAGKLAAGNKVEIKPENFELVIY